MTLTSLFCLYIFLITVSAQQTLQLYENHVCKQDGMWRCKKASECQTLELLVKSKKGFRPEICNFLGNVVVVCCPPSTGNESLRPSNSETGQQPNLGAQLRPTNLNGIRTKSKQMCEEYAKAVFRNVTTMSLMDVEVEKYDDCGYREHMLIVGGIYASSKEFPHMARIGYGNRQKINWLCSGSLISKKHILTAAHCTDTERGKAQFVRLGDLDITTNNDFAEPITLNIIQHTNHPNYSRGTYYNDIAIYELEREVDLNGHIRPICLNTEDQMSKLTALVTGWDNMDKRANGSDILKKIRSRFLNASQCSSSYPHNKWKSLPNGIDSETQFCADSDFCLNDSGGPLQTALVQPYCMYAGVGVISFGGSCDNRYPGVFTQVSSFVPWIESIVWPN